MATERIRVAHVITRMIVGGAQETVLLAAALADRDRFAPIIVCGPQTGSEGSLHDAVRRRGIELVVLPELVREIHPRRDVAAVPALTQLFRSRQIDIAHTNSSKAGIVGRVAARRAGVPGVVHTVHGWPFHDHQSAAGSTVWKALERRCATMADRLVVVAEADRGKGLVAGIGRPEQYVTIRSGLELAAYDRARALRDDVRREFAIPTDALVVGAVGRLSRQKDPLTVIGAFAQVRRQIPSAMLLLVGDGPLAAQVRERAQALGISEALVMTGLRQDVPRLLQGMDVFLSASLWEGLPRTIIAAMATAIPVVATPADGVQDVVVDGETGRLFAKGDEPGAAAAVISVLRGESESSRFGPAGAQVAARFDAREMTDRLNALYTSVLHR